MAAPDEQQLIRQVKEGRGGAFRLLVEQYMKQAYNIAFGFVNNHDDAEDVAQEAFMRIYQSIASFRGDAEFSTWLYRIVMNLSLNKIRQRKSRVKREVELSDAVLGSAAHHPASHDAETHEHIERALHELPTLQRATVILRHLNGLSTRQVSTILQCSEGTVKTHLHRGLKKMKTLLDYIQK
jgi:RNA polymerase sigma-70 factor (ECF subfamily)